MSTKNDLHLYMIRHGETDWNVRRILQGTADIPLNENGRAQALALADELKEAGLVFDRIYCSPLSRAKDTAMLATGCSAEDLIIDPRLIEIEFAELEGAPYELRDPEAVARLPENLRNFAEDPARFVPVEGGEHFRDVIRRLGSFLADLERTVGGGEKVLIVSHGCALHGLLYNLCGKTDLKTYWEPLLGNCRLAEWKKGELII